MQFMVKNVHSISISIIGRNTVQWCNLLSHTITMLFITTSREYGLREVYPTLKLHSRSTSISRVSAVCEWFEGECRFSLIESQFTITEYRVTLTEH